ncbi:MAG: enoyl-CoA hydratase/isomerase family protein [Candidatus Rokubacteria bacterium]|nr:enoyl-CoA hydratase/isomerase family protein [Candidatus Rokubacteria bacterium]
MSYETVLVESRAGVGTITLNRPEVRNALNATMVREIWEALQALEGDREIRVVILKGAGDKAFCAGADLKGLGDRGTTLQAREAFGGLAKILEGIPRMKKPVIAQVHGYALAGGCGLAVGCDLLVASDDAVFGLPEITVGLLPLMVMAPIFRAVGIKRGLPLVLTGEQITAREAYQLGLVTRVVARDELEPAARALAEKLASLSPTALGLAKEAAYTIQDMEYGKSLKYLRELITLVGLSDDAKEGIAAFFEKRPPRWTGR